MSDTAAPRDENEFADEGAASAGDTAMDAIAAECEELKERLLRLTAEFQNYKKRIAREQDRARDQITMDVLREFLPVVDHFDHAIEAAATTDLEGMRAGLKIIAESLMRVIQNHGVEEIQAVGLPFDHREHDALVQIPDPSVPEGTVVNVVSRGYRLRGMLLRPAKVVVSTGGAKSDGENDADL